MTPIFPFSNEAKGECLERMGQLPFEAESLDWLNICPQHETSEEAKHQSKPTRGGLPPWVTSLLLVW